jgi:hypothetical protein
MGKAKPAQHLNARKNAVGMAPMRLCPAHDFPTRYNLSTIVTFAMPPPSHMVCSP